MKKMLLSFALLSAFAINANADILALGSPSNRVGGGGPEGAQPYMWDDGVAENSIGVDNASLSFAWMTQFNALPGAQTINSMSVVFGTNGNNLNGLTANVFIWSDPNGDSNPNDATILATSSGTISGAPAAAPQTNNWVDFTLPDTFVGPAGTSFFVGVVLNNMPSTAGNNFPAAIDQSGDQTTLNRTWAAFITGGGAIDPANLGAPGSNLTDINTIAGLGGRWMVRADFNAIPEPGSALLLLGFTGLFALKRRSR